MRVTKISVLTKVKLTVVLFMLGFLTLVACAYTPEEIPGPSGFLEGEVIWVGGNLTRLEINPESDGFVSYSNETVRFGDPVFIFGVQTSDGVYTIQLDPTDKGGTEGPQTVHNLAEVIEVGTRIRFPTELYGRRNPIGDALGFSKSKIGMLDPDDIEVLI